MNWSVDSTLASAGSMPLTQLVDSWPTGVVTSSAGTSTILSSTANGYFGVRLVTPSNCASCVVGRAASMLYCARHSAVVSNSTWVGVVRVKSACR